MELEKKVAEEIIDIINKVEKDMETDTGSCYLDWRRFKVIRQKIRKKYSIKKTTVKFNKIGKII